MPGCLIYDETSARTGPIVPYDQINATGGWLRHFDNLLYLEFIAGHSQATWIERQQAEREIIIAKRKMAYHAKHPNWDQSAVEAGMVTIKRKWGK